MPSRASDKHFFERTLFVIFAVLTGLVGYARWSWLNAHPFPLDYGGFYYLQETAHRLEFGRGYYHSFSPFFAWMAFLAGYSSPMGAYNLIVIGSFVTFAFAIGLIAGRRTTPWIGAGTCFLILQTEPFFFAHYAYLKQSSAMALFALGLLALEVSRAAGRHQLMPTIFALALFTLGGIYHRFAAVCALIGVLSLAGSRNAKILVVSSAVIAGLIAAYAWFSPKHLLSHLSWPGRLAWEIMGTYGTLSSLEVQQYRLYSLTACIVVLAGVRSKAKLPWLLWSACFLLTLPIWRVSGGLWYRFPLSSLWLFFPALALSQGGEAGDDPLSLLRRSLLPFLILSALILDMSIPALTPPIGPPMRVESLARSAGRLQEWIPDGALVKASHGLQFRVTYFLKRASTRSELQADAPLRYSLGRKPPPAAGDCAVLRSFEGPIPNGTNCVQLDEEWFIWKEQPGTETEKRLPAS